MEKITNKEENRKNYTPVKVMSRKPRGSITSTLFVIPYLVMFLAFMLIPIVYGIYISLHDWELLNDAHTFVGIQNYLDLFNSDTRIHSIFLNGLGNTIKFVVFSVPLLVIIGLALALLVNSLPNKIRGLFRTTYFISYSISVSVISVIWLWLLSTNAGLINEFLGKFGISSIPWLTSLPYAWIGIVGATVWWTVGFNMIILINALNEVPGDLYEAGEIDGASAWQKLFYITLPSIRPMMLFVVIMSTIASFNIYGQPLLMTGGGPGNSTKVLLMEIVEEAFNMGQVGTASAMSIMMALIMVVVSIFQFRISNGKGGQKNE